MRISPEVEVAFSLATREAAKRHHEYVTLEHLTYALLLDTETAEVIKAAGGNLAKLKARLEAYLDTEVERLEAELQPSLSLAFQRVTGRAAMHLQGSPAHRNGPKELRGPNLLIAMFAERDCRAVAMLGEHGLTRYDIVNYVSHRIAKNLDEEEAPAAAVPAVSGRRPGLLLEAMLALAGRDAARRRHQVASLAHVLYCLLLTDEGAGLIRSAGGDVAALKGRLDRHLDSEIERSPSEVVSTTPLSPRALACVERLARTEGAGALEVTEMVAAICEDADAPTAAILREHGITSLKPADSA